jgi:hypothetical protein
VQRELLEHQPDVRLDRERHVVVYQHDDLQLLV